MSKPLRAAEDSKWRELRLAGDFVGLACLRATQLKRKRKLSAAERKFLARFEADRQSVLRDPRSVWAEGCDSAHRGLLLLAWVLHEQQQQGKDETRDGIVYDAMMELFLLARDVRNDLIRYAENGSRLACFTIFREGKAMANAFSRLALTSPELFRELRRCIWRSGIMPATSTIIAAALGRCVINSWRRLLT